ncbi:MAG: gliding motility lipoprotein GldD [Bacteroidia bacterium]
MYSLSHLLLSCSDGNYSPKPAGYPRIDLPEREYTDFKKPGCAFSFRVPKYASIELDKNRGAEPCWYNIDYPAFNAKIHLSYKSVSSFKNFYEMSEDAHTFAYKHTVKAEDIYDSAFYFPANKTSGFLFSIEGNTASAIQFYATDSSKHYLRGALYFNAQPNKDSLQPVVNFIRADIDTLLKSLKWR